MDKYQELKDQLKEKGLEITFTKGLESESESHSKYIKHVIEGGAVDETIGIALYNGNIVYRQIHPNGQLGIFFLNLNENKISAYATPRVYEILPLFVVKGLEDIKKVFPNPNYKF